MRDVILKTYKEEKNIGAQIGNFLSKYTKPQTEEDQKEKKVYHIDPQFVFDWLTKKKVISRFDMALIN